jgi:DNA-3-methyladenine glycosylase II
MKTSSFALCPIAPFRLDLTVWALRRRARNVIDRWDGTAYRRVMVVHEEPLEVLVTQSGTSQRPRLRVTLTGGHINRESQDTVAAVLTRMLGLRIDLGDFYRLADGDTRLGDMVERFRGLKPPRFSDVFEGLVNAVACQQLSLTVGIELLNRVARQCGPAIQSDRSIEYGFPRSKDLLRLKAETLRELGFSYRKAQYLLEVSRREATGQIDSEQIEHLDNQAITEMLLKLRGIGRWTAEYVLLRGLGRTNVFPGDDVGARNRLALWLGLRRSLDYSSTRRIVNRWQPYAGLVYLHLLLAGLTRSGEILQTGPLAIP